MDYEAIKKRAVKGIVAVTGRTIILQAISAAAFFLLGIFLSPAAVGVFIIVTAIMRFFNLFTEVGLGAALVQRGEEPEDEDLATAFTIQEILVTAAVIVGLVITPLVSRWAGLDSAGRGLYWAVLAALFLNSLKAVPSILLERALAFDKQIIPQIAEAIVFNVVLVGLACLDFGVTAFTGAMLASALAGLPIYYWVSPWRPSFCWQTARAKRLLSFGLTYQGKSFLAVVKDDLLTVFLAGLIGPAGVGFWGWAQRWAYSPFRLIVDSVTRVTFPAYARMQEEKKFLAAALEKSLFGVSAVLFPVLGLMILLFPVILELVPRYQKWEPALPSFYFLCAGAGVSALSNLLTNTLDATGQVRTTLKLMVMWIVLTWVLTLALVPRFGFTGVAAASFSVSLSIMVTIYLVKKSLPFRFLPMILPALAATGVMVGGGGWLLSFLPASLGKVGAGAVSGLIIYGGIMLFLAHKEITGNVRILTRIFFS